MSAVTLAFAWLAALAAASPPPAAPSAHADATPRVILVTLDGVRWQDVLGARGALDREGHPVMPALWKRLAKDGVLWTGDRALTSSREPKSLPGYQALMAGGPTPCTENACARIGVETLPERLARELDVPPHDVAVFASWSRVARAATSKAPAQAGVHVDAPPDGPATGAGPPWDNARWDDDTARLALAHLAEHAPRFLWLALLDMDEHAHARDARRTVLALRAADRALGRVLRWVDALPAAERARTTVIVTTDHGRGPGPFWFDHRAALASSREIFVAAFGARVEPLGPAPRTPKVTQADVRPTIEALFGLAPTTVGGGAPIPEVAGPCVTSLGAAPPDARPPVTSRMATIRALSDTLLLVPFVPFASSQRNR